MWRLASILFAFFFLLGCDSTPHTIVKAPDAKAWTKADIDALVDTEVKTIHSPTPTQNVQPPAECDYIRYLSLAPKDAGSNPDAFLMLGPGMQMGIGALSHLAKNLIYMAKIYSDANIKVFIVERRGNCLENNNLYVPDFSRFLDLYVPDFFAYYNLYVPDFYSRFLIPDFLPDFLIWENQLVLVKLTNFLISN